MRWWILVVLVACGYPYVPAEGAHVETHATAVGAKAPELRGASASGGAIALADVIGAHDRTVVVFYRGFY